MNKKILTPLWKGSILYQDSLILQEQIKQKITRTQTAFILGFECPSCITLGLRGNAEADLSGTILEYKKKNIEVVTIKRGGQATLHSPGQLVIYLLMDLLQWKKRPREFLSILEKITQQTLSEYGIVANKEEDWAGLFTQNGKIAFFGIHISSGVSQHGLAINIHNNLKLFNLIRSCGVSHRPHDSFQNHQLSPSLKEVFLLWCNKAQSFFIPILLCFLLLGTSSNVCLI